MLSPNEYDIYLVISVSADGLAPLGARPSEDTLMITKLDPLLSRPQSPDHCLIGGTCLAPLDLDPSDSCYVCDPHQDRDDWAVVDCK